MDRIHEKLSDEATVVYKPVLFEFGNKIWLIGAIFKLRSPEKWPAFDAGGHAGISTFVEKPSLEVLEYKPCTLTFYPGCSWFGIKTLGGEANTTSKAQDGISALGQSTEDRAVST